MSDTMYDSESPRPRLPDPATAPQLFHEILLRRVVAYFMDIAILCILCFLVAIFGLIAGLLTFGLVWVILPFAIPALIAGYYAVTLGSPARATLGMQAMDIVLTPVRGRPLDGFWILIHPLTFWFTVWFTLPVSLAIALFTPRREMLHDLITGTLMVRRSPMVRHWRAARP